VDEREGVCVFVHGWKRGGEKKERKESEETKEWRKMERENNNY